MIVEEFAKVAKEKILIYLCHLENEQCLKFMKETDITDFNAMP